MKTANLASAVRVAPSPLADRGSARTVFLLQIMFGCVELLEKFATQKFEPALLTSHMASLPSFDFQSSHLSDDEAFERWRSLMAAVFTIEPNPLVPNRPRGGLSCHILGEVMASRLWFNPQRMARRKALVNATPDHLTFQLYHSGGFVGEIAGQATTLQRGLVVVADMRFGLDTRVVSSNTSGLSIPRRLLDGVDLCRPLPVLDRDRNRLLAARIVALHRDLPTMDDARVPAVTEELVAFLRRLFDRSSAVDVLEGAELDIGVRSVAESIIRRELGDPRLSPALIAERAHVSRATLYRAFAPQAVMEHVRDVRLEAVHGVLSDATDRRSMAQVATDHGFSSLSLLSRSYRARFGRPPSEARAVMLQTQATSASFDITLYESWWRDLGTR